MIKKPIFIFLVFIFIVSLSGCAQAKEITVEGTFKRLLGQGSADDFYSIYDIIVDSDNNAYIITFKPGCEFKNVEVGDTVSGDGGGIIANDTFIAIQFDETYKAIGEVENSEAVPGLSSGGKEFKNTYRLQVRYLEYVGS